MYNYYKKKKGKEKTAVQNKVNISERPDSANNRMEFGHFEADTIFSCKGSKSALLADRFARKTHIKKPERNTSSLTGSSIVFALSEYNILHLHTITYDNGSEFVKYEDVNKLLRFLFLQCVPQLGKRYGREY